MIDAITGEGENAGTATAFRRSLVGASIISELSLCPSPTICRNPQVKHLHHDVAEALHPYRSAIPTGYKEGWGLDRMALPLVV